ncbi:MAG: universal stress protein [Pseudomonadota bacterium]
MIRDILVNLSQGTDTDRAAAFATSLAAKFSAHLTGLAVTYEIDVPPFYMGALPTDFLETQMQENTAAAIAAGESFAAHAAAAGVTHEVRTLNGSLGIAASSLAEMSRVFDLTVVAQPDPDRPGPEEVIAETVLLESGRSVLVVPYVQREGYGCGRAVVAWDGSRAAARALAEGLPLLHRAAQVEVLRVVRASDEAANCDEVLRHLARHGLSATTRTLHVGNGEPSIAQTILNEVSDQGADLVVMGGYGHSRLRELVMGGVTREILSAMTVPVLMAH